MDYLVSVSTNDFMMADTAKKLAASDDIYKKARFMVPPPLALTGQQQYSLKPDMAFGWRPTNIVGAPIPMYFNYEQAPLPVNSDTKLERPLYY